MYILTVCAIESGHGKVSSEDQKENTYSLINTLLSQVDHLW